MDVAGMQNARLGAIYLWQGTTLDSPLAKTVIGGALSSMGSLAGLKEINIPIPDQATDVLAMGVSAANDTSGSGDLLSTIKAWAQDFVHKVWAKVKDDITDTDLDLILEHLADS